MSNIGAVLSDVFIYPVMPARDAGIHVSSGNDPAVFGMDARIKSGHDGRKRAARNDRDRTPAAREAA